MRRALVILWLCSTYSLAEQPLLRFSVAQSWSMPLMRIEQRDLLVGRPGDSITAPDAPRK